MKRVVALVLALVLCLSMFACSKDNVKSGSSGKNSPTKVAKAYVNAFFKRDWETVFDLYPEFCLKHLAEEQFGIEYSDKTSLLRKIQEESDDDDMVAKIKITNTEIEDSIDKDSLKKQIQDNLTEIDYGENIDEVELVKVNYEIEDADLEGLVPCVKISGKWYVFDIDFLVYQSYVDHYREKTEIVESEEELIYNPEIDER